MAGEKKRRRKSINFAPKVTCDEYIINQVEIFRNMTDRKSNNGYYFKETGLSNQRGRKTKKKNLTFL